MRIVFLDAATVFYGKTNMAPLAQLGSYKAYAYTKAHQTASRIKNADIVISNKVVIGKNELATNKKTKLICVAATGYNNIDITLAQQQGIGVCNSVGYSTESVAEQAIMFLFALSHRLLEHHQASLSGKWSRYPVFSLTMFPYENLKNKTLGIVGYGAIGKRVGQLAKKLGMNVLIAKIPGRKYTSKLKRHSLEKVLKKSDFITLHCPLSPLTFHLINRTSLKHANPWACLLNLSRGPLVDETAIALALLNDELRAYATDVMIQEPPSQDHPFFDKKLKDKVIITPHVAWASEESRQSLVDDMAKNINAFIRGKKRNRIV